MLVSQAVKLILQTQSKTLKASETGHGSGRSNEIT